MLAATILTAPLAASLAATILKAAMDLSNPTCFRRQTVIN